MASDEKQVDELCEDMEVVGPGQMLSEARKKLSFSTDHIANKLNFKTSLVESIEQDKFDQKLPATFNRGYLRSYAKLVNVNVDEVLSAYDLLGIAEVQRSEMQSFSNLTEKEAEHSRLMWFSYFIAAILIGLMILWWQQEPNKKIDEKVLETQPTPTVQEESLDKNNGSNVSEQKSIQLLPEKLAVKSEKELPINGLTKEETVESNIVELDNTQVQAQTKALEVVTLESRNLDNVTHELQKAVDNISTAVFTFSGDCWVNIYDANGERIAWGVKKSGYVMTISGQAPLKVTLGKPELADIVFNDQQLDMSAFSVGNIAKFNLPLKL